MKYADKQNYVEPPIERYQRLIVGNHVCAACFANPCQCGLELYATDVTFKAVWAKAQRSRMGGEVDALQTLSQS